MPVAWILTLCLLLSTIGSAAEPPTARETPRQPTLTTRAEAEAAATPDLAVIRLGAEAQAEAARSAQDTVNGILEKTIEAVRDLGVDGKDIQTRRLELHPVYASREPRPARAELEEPRLVGYRAGNVVEVRVSDLAKIGPVVDAAVRAGANRLEGVSFELRDDLETTKKALADAARRARVKAEALADALEVTITGVEEIVEGDARVHSPQPLRTMAAETIRDTPVEPGEIRVRAAVTVTYRIAPR